MGIQSIYREENMMISETPDPKPAEDVAAHGGHWPDPADDIEAGIRHPAPQAGIRHPAPQAGIRHPAPQAGIKRPAPGKDA